MPSHKIHLAVANKVNEKLKMDLDSIMLGSVMPDICIGRNYIVSHYQNGKLGVEGTANPDLFVQHNKDKLDNPVVLGCLIHILTDKFYNTFAFTNFFIYDENGNDIGLHFKNRDKLLEPGKVKYYKQKEFTLYDKWLLNNGHVVRFKDFKCLDNVIDLDVAKYDKEHLKQYIIDANNDIDNLNILKKINLSTYKLTTKKEFDKQFGLCCEYIINYINSIYYYKSQIKINE